MLFDSEAVNRLLAAEHRRVCENVKPSGDDEERMREMHQHAMALSHEGGLPAAKAKKFERLSGDAHLSVARDKYGQLVVEATFGSAIWELVAFALLFWFHEESAENDEILSRCDVCGSPFYSTGGRKKCSPSNKRCFNWSASFVQKKLEEEAARRSDVPF